MTNSRTLVLWRHGRTSYNNEARFQGDLDPPLDEAGREQARAAAKELAGIQPVLLVSSDLSRAVQTAEELAPLAGLKANCDARLREHNVGVWAGLTEHDVEERFPLEYRAWRSGVYPRSWEPIEQVAARAFACLEGALELLPAGGTAVVVSHGGTIRALVGRMLGLCVTAWWSLPPMGNCRWASLVEGTERWALTAYNCGAQRHTTADPQQLSAEECRENLEPNGGFELVPNAFEEVWKGEQ